MDYRLLRRAAIISGVYSMKIVGRDSNDVVRDQKILNAESKSIMQTTESPIQE
jgi:hypothetical protein